MMFSAFEQITDLVNVFSDMVLKDKIIWQKTNPMVRNRDRRYISNIEICTWFVRSKKSKWTFNRQDEKYESCVLRYPSESGGGFTMYGSTITLLNSIVWGNVSENNQQMNLNGEFTINYSDIEGLPASLEGNGNIDLDPMFIGSENGDFHLSSDSPCIDAGDPDSPLDPDGSVSDMGAFPYQMILPEYPNYSLSFGGNSSNDFVLIDNYQAEARRKGVTVSLLSNSEGTERLVKVES